MSEPNERSNIVEFPELKFPPIEYGVTEAALAELAERYKDPDASTDDGYEQCKDGCRELTALRTAIETRRKDLKAPALNWGRDVDKQAKDIVRRIKTIENPVREEKERVDEIKQAEARMAAEAEQARVDSIRQRIQDIRDSVQRIHAFGIPDVKQVAKEIDGLDGLLIDDSFGEFADEAGDAKIAALAKLHEIHVAATARDEDARKRKADQARLDKEREELEAAQEKQREAEAKLEKETREAGERKAVAEKAAKVKADREREQKAEIKKRRVDNIQDAISEIAEFGEYANGSASIRDSIKALEARELMAQYFEEFFDEARRAKIIRLESLRLWLKETEATEERQRRDEEARLPDKDKLLRWCDAIDAIPEPQVLNDKAQKTLRRYAGDLSKFLDRLRCDIGKL